MYVVPVTTAHSIVTKQACNAVLTNILTNLRAAQYFTN